MCLSSSWVVILIWYPIHFFVNINPLYQNVVDAYIKRDQGHMRMQIP